LKNFIPNQFLGIKEMFLWQKTSPIKKSQREFLPFEINKAQCACDFI